VEVEGLIEEILRNREEVYSASKSFLKDEISRDDYLPELERFWRKQLEALDRFYSEVKKLNPIEMAKMVNRVRADPQLANLYHVAKRVGRKLSEVDRRLGEWAAMVLEERLKEAGEPPVPIAPRRVPGVVVREPPAQPAEAIEAPEPRVRPLVVPEPTTRIAPTIAPQLETPKAEVPVKPQPQVQAPKKEIDRAAIITAVERAVVKVRTKRSPMEVYRDLDGLLNGDLAGSERQLVFLCRLMMTYLLGAVSYEDLIELSEDYIGQLKSSKGPITKPEVKRLAAEAARLAEEREELKPFASFVQLYLSGANPGAQEVRESWYRSPSS
jgi:hypothetical protein